MADAVDQPGEVLHDVGLTQLPEKLCLIAVQNPPGGASAPDWVPGFDLQISLPVLLGIAGVRWKCTNREFDPPNTNAAVRIDEGLDMTLEWPKVRHLVLIVGEQ